MPMSERENSRRALKQNYNKIDNAFINEKVPKNPYDYIDKKKKKVDINPGAKYVSSSQFEVLEPRFEAIKKGKKKKGLNKYLVNNNYIEKLTYQDVYIEPVFEAYQLKTEYQIKQLEEIEFDDDEEDNLILAI